MAAIPPMSRMPGNSNLEKGVMRKFVNGQLTVEHLKKLNAAGRFLCITTEGRGYFCNYGINSEKNYITIEKKTQKELQTCLLVIKANHPKIDIEEYFKIITRIVP